MMMLRTATYVVVETLLKVRDHSHATPFSNKGPAHNNCNQKCQDQDSVSIIFTIFLIMLHISEINNKAKPVCKLCLDKGTSVNLQNT